MLDNNTVYFLNIIWTYCTCMYYVSEINEYYYIIIHSLNHSVELLSLRKKSHNESTVTIAS